MTLLILKRKISLRPAYSQIKDTAHFQWSQDYSFKTVTSWLSHNQLTPTSLCNNKINLIIIKKAWIKDFLFQNIREIKLSGILRLQINSNPVFKIAIWWARAGKQSIIDIETNYICLLENIEIKLTTCLLVF